jgi:tRNA uridine 5-carboxymethylaminomethyl modification enzyme
VRSIAGLDRAHITRPGYAIEYDYFDPKDLRPSLETRSIHGLFFAGQINGTTGYEEAAAQGLMAGINAVQYLRGDSPWIPRRDQAYIGVLVDDLITCGTSEPYRMFTSRAEYRLLLREDNADMRLTEQGHSLGVVSDDQWIHFERKCEAIEQERNRLRDTWIRPAALDPDLQINLFGGELTRDVRALDLLARPQLSYAKLMQVPGVGPGTKVPKVAEQIEIQAHYEGYIARQRAEIERQRRHDETPIPDELDYTQVHGLSSEVREKLLRYRPFTVGQAARISGITPAAISLLLIHLKRCSV